ncbi:MAG: hypothetical protein H7A51_14900 [Akkermansiaceae bacterium]|nr:hypothetical protein [Akkermansiaceae bacterium]
MDDYLPRLCRARDALRQAGVVYSLNPWTTLGHADRGRPMIDGARCMVGHDGRVARSTACPLCPEWRAYMRSYWRKLAGTEPAVIWVEDDIRSFNHAPVQFGCFCDAHLERFSEFAGEKVDRQSLVDALERPGPPHPWRALWMRLQGDVMVDTAALLGDCVREVSPGTRLGLMSSGPRNHAVEGRDWSRFCEALGGGQPVYSRPTMGCYDEGWASPRGLYFSQDSVKLTRHVCPPATIDLTEVENVHFSAYANSRLFSELKIMTSIAYGAAGVTMNTFDHMGTPMREDEAAVQALSGSKARMLSLGRETTKAGAYRGVRLHFPTDLACHKQLRQGESLASLQSHGQEAVEMFETHGLATTYDESPVSALTGQIPRALSDDTILRLLGGGLFLDGEAASILVERGFGAEIGVAGLSADVGINDPLLAPLAAEEHMHPGFDGAENNYLTCLLPSFSHDARFYPAELLDGAEVVSRLVDNERRVRQACMIAFENERGGRVVTHLWKLSSAWGAGFKHAKRATQLQAAVRWISGDRPPLITTGGAYPLAMYRDLGTASILGMANLGFDAWPQVTWEFYAPQPPASVSCLAVDGRWLPATDLTIDHRQGRCLLRLNRPVAFGESVFLKLHF